MNIGPETTFSEQLHSEKHRQPGETFADAVNRIISILADNSAHKKELWDIFSDMRFMPGGRVQASIGSEKQVTPYNCFVSGTISDSFVEGSGSIMNRAKQAATIMRMGGGIGYDFSTLRPRGALIKKLQSKSSGPVQFMHIFDAICRATASTSDRRGAQMAVLRIDHPDILEFIRSKNNQDQLTGFNISVGVTDEFMECLELKRPFTLRWKGDYHKTVDALELWDEIMKSNYHWAEPGVLFLDTINKWNNLYYCEKISATNPCAEQPLPPYGACLLGSFNLNKYVTLSKSFDFDFLRKDIPFIIRAMDNIIDIARYPLKKNAEEAFNKRRMGIGVFGLANAIEYMGFPYGSNEFLKIEEDILCTLRDEAYIASSEIAKEKGSFPLYNKLYLNGKFIQKLPSQIKNRISKNGIRNSHLLSIAPTGTMAMTADNSSSSIENVIFHEQDRTIMMKDGKVKQLLQDYAVRKWGVYGKITDQVSLKEHMNVLQVAARNVDSSVSKTINCPNETSFEEFKQVYSWAWNSGVKGCTTYRIGASRSAIIEQAGAACQIDPNTGKKQCD